MEYDFMIDGVPFCIGRFWEYAHVPNDIDDSAGIVMPPKDKIVYNGVHRHVNEDWNFRKDGICYRKIAEEEGTLEVVSPYCSPSAHLVIPETLIFEGKEWTVTRIATGFYESTSGVNDVILPASIRYIGPRVIKCDPAYRDAPLTSITCLAKEPPKADYRAFFRGIVNVPLYVPAESIPAYKAVGPWRNFANIKAIEEK